MILVHNQVAAEVFYAPLKAIKQYLALVQIHCYSSKYIFTIFVSQYYFVISSCGPTLDICIFKAKDLKIILEDI